MRPSASERTVTVAVCVAQPPPMPMITGMKPTKSAIWKVCSNCRVNMPASSSPTRLSSSQGRRMRAILKERSEESTS